jgi:hypothetical protein
MGSNLLAQEINFCHSGSVSPLPGPKDHGKVLLAQWTKEFCKLIGLFWR